ncbi:MAG: radical SAM protein [Nanoarchaeota archaeon]|nr:radical SAM protein [Nanoarchaeota archaeon]
MIKEVIIPENYKYISAFLTMRCNLGCSFCLNKFSDKFYEKEFKELSGKNWVDSLNKLKSKPDIPITFSGGEPFLHKDFIYILNNIKSELNIDILTNLQWGNKGIERFISEVNPERIKRDSPYSSMRVSYHPEQMDAENLINSVKKMKDAGFSIGIWAVLYPSPQQLSAINQMQFRCKDAGIEFRLKEFTGEYKGELYGDYSKYLNSAFQEKTTDCLCKTSELLIGPSGDVYRCHRDVFSEENAIDNITDPNFEIKEVFRKCNNYGQCHPCDVKSKTNYKQEIGHTSVEIKEIK